MILKPNKKGDFMKVRSLCVNCGNEFEYEKNGFVSVVCQDCKDKYNEIINSQDYRFVEKINSLALFCERLMEDFLKEITEELNIKEDISFDESLESAIIIAKYILEDKKTGKYDTLKDEIIEKVFKKYKK